MKKKKTTLGLSSEFNDLGSPFLHQHFMMMLERMGKSDKLVRSRISNQTMFDLLHVLELIDNHQHSAGEYLLEMAVKSGYFLNPINYEPQTQKNSPPASASNYALRSLRIARIMRVLRQELGGESNYVFDVVVLNHPIRTQDDLDLVRRGLDIIQASVGIGYSPNLSPLLALQSVVKVA
jgi:hypothetical protein|tara:strand:+ start:471 stop:1007 length:537 start_codon:yes stop_codon:yes gene_type:complete